MRTLGFLIASFCVPIAIVAAPFLDDEAGIAPMPRTSGQVKSVEITGGEPKVKLATRVGGKVDQADLRRDLQTLWATGLFLDIRVQITEASDGTAVVFEGKPKAALYLRELRMEPHSFGMQPSLTAGTPIDAILRDAEDGQLRESRPRGARPSLSRCAPWVPGRPRRSRTSRHREIRQLHPFRLDFHRRDLTT